MVFPIEILLVWGRSRRGSDRSYRLQGVIRAIAVLQAGRRGDRARLFLKQVK